MALCLALTRRNSLCISGDFSSFLFHSRRAPVIRKANEKYKKFLTHYATNQMERTPWPCPGLSPAPPYNIHTLRLVLIHGLDQQRAGQSKHARIKRRLGRMNYKSLGKAMRTRLTGAARTRHGMQKLAFLNAC